MGDAKNVVIRSPTSNSSMMSEVMSYEPPAHVANGPIRTLLCVADEHVYTGTRRRERFVKSGKPYSHRDPSVTFALNLLVTQVSHDGPEVVKVSASTWRPSSSAAAAPKGRRNKRTACASLGGQACSIADAAGLARSGLTGSVRPTLGPEPWPAAPPKINQSRRRGEKAEKAADSISVDLRLSCNGPLCDAGLKPAGSLTRSASNRRVKMQPRLLHTSCCLALRAFLRTSLSTVLVSGRSVKRLSVARFLWLVVRFVVRLPFLAQDAVAKCSRNLRSSAGAEAADAGRAS